MTEAEWLKAEDSYEVTKASVEQRPGLLTHRKMLLFACVSCRRMWNDLDKPSRGAVEVAEAYADGRVGEEDFNEAIRAARETAEAREVAWISASKVHQALTAGEVFPDNPLARMEEAAGETSTARWDLPQLVLWLEDIQVEEKQLCNWLRCLFGNPFRPAPVFDPAWLAWNDGAVRKMAQVIYDERRFSDLPLLADALEDSGCVNADILAHCRSGTEHARGCFVVDLLTGRE